MYYYIMNKSHTKFIETISKADNESRISGEDVGDGGHSISKGKLSLICHN